MNDLPTGRREWARPFFVVWSGQAISLLGSQLVQFAIVWWLTRTTHSASMLALASLAALLPQILIGPVAGTLVDRWSRRTVMIVADSGIALATLALAGLFWLGHAEIWAIYALLVIRAIGAAFHWPAMQASTTLMVPGKHLARVAGLNQTLAGVAGIFIPPLGALAIEALPLQGVLMIDVATAIPAVACLLVTAIPQPERAQPASAGGPSVWGEMREGLHFVWSWKALLTFGIICILINTFGRAAAALLPLLVTEHFKGGALQLGWLQSAVGIGAVAGGLLLGVWGGFRRKMVTAMLALILDGAAIVVLGLSPQEAFVLAVGIAFLVGGLETIVIGLDGAIGQAIVPPEMQGRVFSLMTSLTQGLSPLGLLAAGPTADAFGVPFWFVLTGFAFAAMGALALVTPGVARIEEGRGELIISSTPKGVSVNR